MAGLRTALTEPDIGRHLLREEGEVVVDVVRRHWVVFVGPALVAGLGLLLLVLTAWAPVGIGWLPLLLGFALIGWAAWRALASNVDCLVVTNMRVFRVRGVFARSLATMPLTRILDITVVKPLQGRILGYGHFTFESAAQDQGLHQIRYVGRPDERDLVIQRVVQRAGLRGPRVVN